MPDDKKTKIFDNYDDAFAEYHNRKKSIARPFCPWVGRACRGIDANCASWEMVKETDNGEDGITYESTGRCKSPMITGEGFNGGAIAPAAPAPAAQDNKVLIAAMKSNSDTIAIAIMDSMKILKGVASDKALDSATARLEKTLESMTTRLEKAIPTTMNVRIKED